MKKVHYTDLVIGQTYYFDEDFQDFGTYVKKSKKAVSFNNSNTTKYAYFKNLYLGFAIHDELFFYEKPNQ